LILPDHKICEKNILRPHLPHTNLVEQDRVISYGESSYGYDLRCGYKFSQFVDNGQVLDPKNITADDYITFEMVKGEPLVLEGKSFVLGESIETFHMPDYVMGVCVGKSTYARTGIIVSMTPLEPGWKGVLTLEIYNSLPMPVSIYPGEGICQVIFFEGGKCNATYADRNGKYQNQAGLTQAKV